MDKKPSVVEADYRTISQQYAQGGINSVILINGGAAAAVLSQFEHLKALMTPLTIGSSMILYALGVLAGTFVWLAGFLSTRHVDRTLRGQNDDYRLADQWMTTGVIAILCSGVFFLLACMVLAIGLIRV